jgi:hypothetical protein
MQPNERRPGAAALGRRVGVGGDQRMPREDGLHDLPLHPDPAAVDQPYLDEAPGLGGFQIVGDDRGDVPRRERVQVQRILDRDADGLLVYSRGPPSTCSFQ